MTVFDSCSRPYIADKSCFLLFLFTEEIFLSVGLMEQDISDFFFFLWGVQAKLLWNFNGRN